MSATTGDDTLDGTPSGDTIDGLGGNDVLNGRGFDDLLIGNTGDDTLTGAQGDDTLSGGEGNDLFTGDLGADSIDGGDGADTMLGGLGDGVTDLEAGTSQSASHGNDSLSSIEYLEGFAGRDTILGSAGAETIASDNDAGFDNDSVDGRGGNDVISTEGGNDTALGGGGDDTIDGGDGADSIFGGDDNDRLLGGGGDDTISGDDGNDTVVYDGQGLDQFSGGAGTDTLDIPDWTGPSDFAGLTTGTYGDWSVINPGIQDIFFNRVSDPSQSVTASGFETIVCFATGTRIETDRGAVPVEALRAGDMIVTCGPGGAALRPALFLGRRRILLAGHPQAEALAPVRIRAGALGAGVPRRDLLVSPDHCLFLDGALVPARLLVNGESIVIERRLAEVTYHHIELGAHDVVLAEGAPAESWLDCGNRSWFENAPVAQARVSGPLAEAGSGWDHNRACAPLVHGGERLAAIRGRIALSAAEAEPAGRRRAG
jgi:Ca2+-binding RTX toxin-like protein